MRFNNGPVVSHSNITSSQVLTQVVKTKKDNEHKNGYLDKPVVLEFIDNEKSFQSKSSNERKLYKAKPYRGSKCRFC